MFQLIYAFTVVPTYGGLIKERYYFVPREKKSQNASRPNRVVTHPIKEGGWWKATQGSKKIFDEKRRIVGYKKSLVFYRYKKDTKKSSKSGEKTNWIMHEFRLAEDDGQAGGKFQQWVLCRIKENKKEGVDKEERQGGGRGENMVGDYRNLNDAFVSLIPSLEQGNEHQQETVLENQQGVPVFLVDEEETEMNELVEMIENSLSYSPKVHTAHASVDIEEQQQQLPQPQQEDNAVLMQEHIYSDGVFYQQQQQPLLPQPQPMEITLQSSQQENNDVNLVYNVIHVMIFG
ncbi:PREDICTED: NAC domain-containing protein 100-like, partial [Nelumbo nucifera]|uniref:NAC domain-containing protein 100-like n=1 Tax=Nelumbo nucifera TaxID=4432 RepID=A0A1U8B214_NELNU